MENDIIVEGFSKAEEMNGLCYTTFIGDGDRSVHATGVPIWGVAKWNALIMPSNVTAVHLKI